MMMKQQSTDAFRLSKTQTPSLRNWEEPASVVVNGIKSNVSIDMGWGRLIFAHTFNDPGELVREMLTEAPGKRDITFYPRDPHVLLSLAPQELFLDPSHTYRLWLHEYRPSRRRPKGYAIHRLHSRKDAEGVSSLYKKRHMFGITPEFPWSQRKSPVLTYMIAHDTASGEVIGTATGIDHVAAFNDPENGCSLWCLAVDPQTHHVGVGEALSRQLAEYYQSRGRAYMDLSVMHFNKPAIALYEKMGFQRVPVFCMKHKNPFNEHLFVVEQPAEAELNPYAEIIVKEARRRGITVDVIDPKESYFRLSLGGRSMLCRESLTELTSAVAMSQCDNKRVTRKVLQRAGLSVPAQQEAGDTEDNEYFLQTYKRLVVKPARGEQGAGISVDVRTSDELERALKRAYGVCDRVLLEELVEGQDLRIIVINFEVVAAAVRRPPMIVGTGEHTVGKLIEKASRRRAAATGGESKIPLDAETRRCVKSAGYDLDSTLPKGKKIAVRKTANLHTGGTIHDVTRRLHPELAKAACRAARALNIPVTGLDFMVPRVDGDEYVIIEANERPGLANHEPQPTAERFIDLLFPQTVEFAETAVAAGTE
jgi:GNAT-family acetyltransferase (TIGR03103 family)